MGWRDGACWSLDLPWGMMPGLAEMQRGPKTRRKWQSMEENEPLCQAEMLWGKGLSGSFQIQLLIKDW